MKTIGIILICGVLLPLFAVGQTERKNQLIEAKAALMKSELHLTAKQVKAFLPLYKDYEQKIAASSAPMRNLRNKIKSSENKEAKVTREQALVQIRTSFSVSQSILDIKKSYVNRFAQILDPTQLLKFYQTEDLIRNKINSELKRRDNP